MSKKWRSILMGLTHCNISHVNNIINRNLLHVMWKDLVVHITSACQSELKRWAYWFLCSQNISTASYCFTIKNLRRPFILEQVPCSHKACSTNRIKLSVLTLLTKLINTVNPDKVTRFQNSDFQPKPPPLPKEKEMKRFQTLKKLNIHVNFLKYWLFGATAHDFIATKDALEVHRVTVWLDLALLTKLAR